MSTSDFSIKFLPESDYAEEIIGLCNINGKQFKAIRLSKSNGAWAITQQMQLPEDQAEAAIALACIKAALHESKNKHRTKIYERLKEELRILRYVVTTETKGLKEIAIELGVSNEKLRNGFRQAMLYLVRRARDTGCPSPSDLKAPTSLSVAEFKALKRIPQAALLTLIDSAEAHRALIMESDKPQARLNLVRPQTMSSQKILFGDLETGGLNERQPDGTLGAESLPIFELAFILTDANLNELAEPLRLVVHQPEEEIAKCDQWAIDTHTKSGLLDEVRASTLTLTDAEQQIIDWLKSNGIEGFKGRGSSGVWLGGNSIMLDRSFILAQMPKLHAFMHYRQFDVSMLAMAARLWAPEVEKKAIGGKQYRHEALADIRETIQELKTYREHLFANVWLTGNIDSFHAALPEVQAVNR